MPTITGLPKDFYGETDLSYGQLIVEFYGETARPDGSDIRLESHDVIEIKDMDGSLVLDAGEYIFTFVTTRTDSTAGRPAFRKQRYVYDLEGDTTWATIQSEGAPIPPGISGTAATLLAQMTSLRDETETISGLTGEDAAVGALVDDDDSESSAALGKKYASQLTTLGTGDETSRINAWLAAPSPLGVKKLVGAANISAALNPTNNTYLDGSSATLTMTADLTSAIVTAGADNVRIYGLTLIGKTTDYLDASSVYNASAIYASGTTDSLAVDGCQLLGWAGAGVHVASTVTGSVSVRNTRMTGAPDEIAVVRAAAGPTAEVNYGAGVRSLSIAPIEIRGCDISGFAQGIVTAKGATVVRIINNYLHDFLSGQHGAYLSLTRKLVFTGNTVENCYDVGVKVQIADPVLPESCDLLIGGNIFKGTGGQAVLVTNIETVSPESDVLSRRVLIVGNDCDDNTRGIQVNIAAEVIVKGNIITNGRALGTGMNFEKCTDLIVEGNFVKNVPLYGARYTDVTRLRSINNTYIDPSTADTASNNFGVHVTGACSDLSFEGDVAVDTVGGMLYGFYFNPTTGLDTLSVKHCRGKAIRASSYGARLGSATAVREWRGNDFVGVAGTVNNRPTSALGMLRRRFDTAPPTTGRWEVGEYIENAAPTVGSPVGWVCTSAGTPGTWNEAGQVRVPNATTTQLTAIGDAINTTGKYAGKMVWNTTTTKPAWASGATAAAVWRSADGTTAHTPA